MMLVVVLFVWTVAQPLRGRGAADQQKLLYVALNGRVAVYDIERDHTFMRTIPISDTENARSIQACASTQTLYVSYTYFKDQNPTYGGIVAIDLVTDQERWRKQFEKEVDAFSLTPDCKKIYASTGESSTKPYDWVVDASNGAILTTIPVSSIGGSHNAVVGPSGKYAYLSSLLYEWLVVADTATDTVIDEVGPFSGAIRPFVVNGRETLAFVNVNGLQGFEVADLRTGQVIQQVKLQPQVANPNYPNPVHGIGLTADETELWQTGADRTVYVFDATVMPPRQIDKVAVSELPKWI